jgi:6-phosphogluconolactonase (cycloisomerase 2 family)
MRGRGDNTASSLLRPLGGLQTFHSTPRWRGRSIVGAFAALAFLGVPAAGAMADPGALYTQTNDPAGNVVQAFDRDAQGALTPPARSRRAVSGSRRSAGARARVELSDDESTVYAVNAGSGSVSAFRVGRDGLQLASITSSGGSAPDSVDEHHGHVYVLRGVRRRLLGRGLPQRQIRVHRQRVREHQRFRDRP